MIINIKSVINKLTGEPFVHEKKELTLASALGIVLTVQKTANPWKQYRLANEIANSESEGHVDFDLDDIVFLKKAVEDNAKTDQSVFFPYILGACIDLLENASKEVKPVKEPKAAK